MKCLVCKRDMFRIRERMSSDDYMECVCGAMCNVDGSDFVDSEGKIVSVVRENERGVEDE